MGAALDQEGVVPPTDPLQPVEEIADQLDLEILDPLEAHVLDRGPLMQVPVGPSVTSVIIPRCPSTDSSRCARLID
jgi:hypothetical protein